jgi:hypothetical protein
MTIDQDDYAPRPADDHFAEVSKDTSWRHDITELRAWNSMLLGLMFRDRKWHRCDQLGCNFSELPHG